MEKEFADLFKVLSDSNRLKIIQLLIQGETCGCTLIDKLPISQPTLSYHLKALTDSGLAKSFRDGNWVKHYIDKEKLQSLIAFLTNLKVSNTTCPS